MRVLALNYEFPPLGGGAGNATAQICRGLVKLGAEVAVLTSGFRGLPSVEKAYGYTVHRVPTLRRRLEGSSPIEMAAFVLGGTLPALKLARSFRPHILHVYFGIPTGPLGFFIKKALGTPYILSLRGGDVPGFLEGELGWRHRFLRPLTQAVWDGAGAVVANSPGLAALAQKSLAKGRVQMVPNGVDLGQFFPSSLPKADGVMRILFVGRLVEQKGVRYIIESLPTVLGATSGGVELEIVGRGPEEKGLRLLVDEMGLSEEVRFSGWLGREKVAERYRASDILVLPSFEEGMPNVVLEAMACGLPVVVSDIYGNRELVRHGENGFLVPVADPRALGEALIRLGREPELRRKMGARSRILAQSCGWDAAAKAYLDLSCQTIGSDSPLRTQRAQR